MSTGPRNESTTERLYRASQHHARLARQLVNADDRFERMDAAYHAGTAVELMAKCIVSHLDDRLLMDHDAGKHTFLEVVAAHHKRTDLIARPKGLTRRTILAASALALADRLSTECRQHRRSADRALAARNGAAHMAEIEDGALSEVVNGMTAYVSAGAETLKRARAEFWGAVVWSEVTQEIASRIRRDRESTATKLSASKRQLTRLVADLPKEKADELIAMLEARPGPAADDAWQVDCPACDHLAWLYWSVDFEPVRVGPDEYDYEGGVTLGGLSCPVCGLELNADEVGYADVGTSDYRESDWEYDEL